MSSASMESTTTSLMCPAPRTSLACDNCRSRKARCLPSRKEGTCQRCLANRASCVFGVRKGPEKAPRSSSTVGGYQDARPPRSAKIDTRQQQSFDDDDILSDLFPKATPKKTAQPSLVTEFEKQHIKVLDDMFPSSTEDTDEHTGHESFKAQPRSSTPTPEQLKLIDESKVSLEQAERLLKKYSRMANVVPCVLLPGNWTKQSMLKDHPFLSLAIFSAMSTSQPYLNRRMDREFRRIIAEKVMVDQEKSLDILQGLLVYLCFYPMHINPRNTQVYHLIQMAVSLVEDFDITSADSGFTPKEIIDIKRAHLGCFYIACSFMSSKYRTMIVYTPYLASLATELNQSTYESDHILAFLFEMAAINNDLRNAKQAFLPENAPEYMPELDNTFLSYSAQINTAVASLSPQLLTYTPIVLAHLSVTMHLYAKCLSPPLHASRSQPISTPNPTAVARCIYATRDMLEAIITLEPTKYRDFSMPEWCRVIQTFVTIFMTLSHIPSIPNLDPAAIKEVLQFGRYIEILCFRMRELSVVDKDSSAPPDVFCLWESVLRIVRKKYGALAKDVGHSMSNSPSGNGSAGGSDRARSGMIRAPATLCPVVNGSLRQSDYWDVWTRSEEQGAMYGDMMMPGLEGVIPGDMGFPMPVTEGWEGMWSGDGGAGADAGAYGEHSGF
ncbi:hypothetical protein BT63DRAFT_291386 [Microthyrium microscopicum]|uniref:Zn(2)-C6 fungal-type domain-containing protein n=1 Tax=Microthyrium microscopicum TaxID=703497 RepID=A0A6A6U941_9PEZI|nr:hypothetical protein BT63DRAFT_291386 [Microthyrium microscopicum]